MSDDARVERARRLATLLDSSIEIPVVGYRIGIDPIVGLVPVVGDWLLTVVSLYIVWQGVQVGVPRLTILRMLFNVWLDAAGGSVPFFGDLFDAYWKANEKNVALLERHVDTADD